MEKLDGKKFKNQELLKGDYSVFTTAEAALILKENLLNIKQKTLYFKPFLSEFSDDELNSLIIQLLKYSKNRIDFNSIKGWIDKIEEESKEQRKRQLIQQKQRIEEELKKLT